MSACHFKYVLKLFCRVFVIKKLSRQYPSSLYALVNIKENQTSLNK